jgi:hypothetical protein
LGPDGREHRGTAGAGRGRGAPRLPCAHEIAAIWLALSDEERDELLAARNEAFQKGQTDE